METYRQVISLRFMPFTYHLPQDLFKVQKRPPLFYNIDMRKRLFLKVGDRVNHLGNLDWGAGMVIEERHSGLSGGFCMVRILFDDGNERSFINDLDNSHCCFYAGMRIL
ncbi:MAG: hypothetical protein AB1499_12215 [Nitrospirota bacterium]